MRDMADVRAARLVRHGGPLEIQTVPLPEPGPGEVVVDLAYAGVNPVDRYGAEGRVAPDAPLPRTLGSEAAGSVDGRAVVVRGHGIGTTRDGVWATAAVVPATAAVPVPDGVDLRIAGSMGVAGVTAWRAVTELSRVRADDRVLVLGAGGAVGSIALSVVRGTGATAWGQTGRREAAAWIRARGAAQVVVGGAETVAEEARALAPTVVVDPLGGPFTGAAVEVMAARGRLVLLGTSAGLRGELPLQALYRKGLTVLGYGGLIEDDAVLARHIGDALEAASAGRLEVVVDRVVPLAEVNDALDALAGRRILGKVVLDLRSSAPKN